MNKKIGITLYGLVWLTMIILLCLGAEDKAFLYMGGAAYFMLALGAAGLRVATRAKLQISGDMISDACACCFALPWAIGQMHAENFDCKEMKVEETKVEETPK